MFPPVHLQPLDRAAFGYAPGDFPLAEDLATRTVALPFFTTLTRPQVEEVAGVLRRVLTDELRSPPTRV